MHKSLVLNARTKVLDTEKGLISAIVSTETPDRDGDIIRAEGYSRTGTSLRSPREMTLSMNPSRRRPWPFVSHVRNLRT